jgi:AP-1 complex subunit beta-1
MVQRVLDMATEESDNPDLRDRGFIYWRLLSTDPEAAKMVVLGDKPVIEDDTFKLDPSLLDILIGQIATLSSVYHKPPESFVVRRGAGEAYGNEDDTDDDDDDNYNEDGGEGEVDLLDMGGLGIDDGGAAPSKERQVPLQKVCGPEKSGGIEILAGFTQKKRKIRLEMELKNVSSPTDVTSLAIQLNKNAFGLSPASQQIVCNPPISQGSTGRTFCELVTTPNMMAPPPAGGQPVSPQVQIAIKNMQSGNVFYFAVNCNFEALFSPDGAMERSAFIESWKSIDDRSELYGTVSDLPAGAADIEAVQQKFKQANVFFIAVSFVCCSLSRPFLF